MKSRLSALPAAALLATLAAAPPAATADTLKPLRIGLSVPDSVHTLIYVAVAKGLMQEEGIEPELVQFNGGGAAAQAITAGAVDVNESSIFEVFDAYAAGRDLTAIWSVSNFPAYTWYSRPGVESVQALKGEGKVGISGLASMTYVLFHWAAERSGLNADKDIKYVAIGGPLERVAALRAGQVDAIPATPPGTFMLEQEGYKPLLDLKTLLPAFEYEPLYARKSKLNDKADEIKALLRATIRAKAWALKHPEETTDILMKNLGAPDDQRAVYRRTVDAVLPYFPADGQFAEESMKLFLNFYKAQGRIKEVPPLSAYTDDRFIVYMRDVKLKPVE